ncbi:hypothetical protein JYT31_00115 [Beggiatoa alba]|nr:hypothetical protein [Beggiatoa alba]
MNDAYFQFACELADYLCTHNPKIKKHHSDPEKVRIQKNESEVACFDLTPFIAKPCPVSAWDLFANISTLEQLLDAYHHARKALPFEDNIKASRFVSSYASDYLSGILENSRKYFSHADARRIANWVKDLDIYTAVKAIESLLNSKADLALFELVEEENWNLHFDHLAIRCGSKKDQSAEQVRDLLIKYHGYTAPQMIGADYIQFDDGWNAYLLYKILNNGQVLRLFVDQSDAHRSDQVIQHWNHVYGYTAHHLAMRATCFDNGCHKDISLKTLMDKLAKKGINILSPTGLYTQGLLQQVFTKPEQNTSIPDTIKNTLAKVDSELCAIIKNAKLLEVVSRSEMPKQLLNKYFSLYGLQYSKTEPHHSAPVYQYFLPAQAAHVIRTSLQV